MAEQTQRQQLVAAIRKSGRAIKGIGRQARAISGGGKRRFAIVTIDGWGTVTLDDRGHVYSAERVDGKKWSLDRTKEPLRSELRREIFDSIILTGVEIRTPAVAS